MTSTIEQALVFIASAIILVPLFQWLKLGSVLGYLMAGIIVGPQCLKLIPNSESILHFAEFGVVLLLFVIGLEIQPRKLWSMKNHLLGLGGTQILVTTIIFTGISLVFGLSTSTALIVGFSLSLSSTAFALQTLTERNQFKTEFGRSSFSVLLMQDLLAIPALAIIPSLAATRDSATAINPWWAVGIILFLVIASRYLIRPMFRMIAATHTHEIFIAAALFVVIGVAALMTKVGLSAALGTFIAGVLLADSEYRHELEANLEPFKSLLMGLFFIGVGMSVSLDLIISNPFTIVGMAIGYLILKSAIIYLVGRIFKMSHQNSKQMAFTISQGGEFAFVIFAMALQFQLAEASLLQQLTAVITLSMALGPIFDLANSKLTERFIKVTQPEFDQINDETPEVIIAGFGRFGQIFGRVLRAQNIPFVAIDHDSDQIDLVRRFGNKVYYGDASRQDLLISAGAAKAKFFILAIDDVEMSVKTAKMLVTHFPHLTVFARARNRGHVFELMDLGITHIKREIFDSSIYFMRDLLVSMGRPVDIANIIMDKFKTHDEIMIKEQFKVRHDDKNFVSVSQQGIAQLAQVLSEDSTKSYIGK